ncbi:LOW QUALITY PROTEIN: chondroitin sulfate proteoglycan 4-like [Palaemon carinicauda]|uniref:LOW QUALITY PROTEIN: chondroitin sulfate proteoglycan 4-like n=1 Tax=Palaemon carinicauda TaxID=392227 RepID=UPI0035B5EF61
MKKYRSDKRIILKEKMDEVLEEGTYWCFSQKPSLYPHGRTASFFGGSYVALPLQEARSTTEISLRLKTHRSDALLLLAAGTTDYCLVVLEGGALRVRINLGAGESELSSPPRLRLDDLLWHDVHISRETADVTLTIDKIHVTRLSLPGRFHELNIHYGVFLGGMGDFTEVFLGLLDNYRGCLDQVMYNGIDILREVQDDPKSADVYGVEWECSEEFDAPADVPISFVRPGAYVAFQDSYPRTGGSISLEIKTQSQNALVMYNTGPPSRSDFIAVEIYEGHPRLVLDTGNGAVDLNSTTYISDGVWHRLEAHFKPTYMELSVDDRIEDQPTHVGENKFFDLSGYLFVGGVEVNKQARAVSQGARNGDKSLEGCIQKVTIGEQAMSLGLARVTSGIKAGCRWAYPCLKNPCVDGARCVQEGTDGFKCHCDLALCVRQNFTTAYKVFTKTTLPFDLEVLSLTPMEVQEGGQALITPDHLHIVLDFEKYGVRESGVLFHVITRPARGRLDVQIGRRQEDNIFTLLDLNHDRVTYIHDGSETTEDSIVLELELVTRAGYILPSYLQSRHRFVLPVRVKSKNDVPSIQLPLGKVIRLATGTAKAITPEIINVIDSDSSPEVLRISVVNLKEKDGGYIQNSQAPGKPIYSFTQEDINQGLISYVHRGEPDNKIALKVSDGIETGELTILRVAAFDLQVYLVNNTGLVMTHGSWALITPRNLSYTTNAPEQELEIRFDLTELPEFGAVQRLRGNDRWQNVNQFSSRQLEKDKIRYLHTTKEPKVDEFRFKISAGEEKFSTEYTFRISFVAMVVEVIRNSELLIDQIQESFISEGFLQSVTRPDPTEDKNIIYSIISPPMYGSLYLSSGDLTRHRQIEKGSIFSQEDIAKGRVKYKLHRKSYSALHDSFQFKVSTDGRSSDIKTFNIRHTPPTVDADIVVERLDVQEGSKQKITSKYLHIEVKDIEEIVFNVTGPPKHGSIEVVDESLVVPARHNATYFTSKELKSGSIFYQHDDSESTKDRFHFVALAADPEVDFQYVGIMHFKIIMINDNHPIRTMEKVLNVVTESERVVTSNDLQYTDPDLDTPPSQIQYTRRKIPNGDFFNVEDKSEPVYIFTQEDIDKRRIVFRHKGQSYGKAVISVTDGHLSSTGILEIVASEPFIEIVNNSGIIVPRGQEAVISNHNLSVETNMNAWGNAVSFLVTKPPKYGNLNIQGQSGTQFTESDLVSNNLKYSNKGDPSFKDEFRFQARVGDTTTDGIFEIKVYPESYWEPLLVLNNNTVKVEEGSRVTIDQTALKIMHPNIAPSDITYVIVQRPQNGYLEVDVGHTTTSEYWDEDSSSLKPEVSVFDQALINEGRVRYVETGTNVTTDHFVFDVTNGISSLSRLVITLKVIPKTIYLLAGSLEVEEGSQTIVTADVVTVLTEYYTDKIGQYLVVKHPSAGQLQLSSTPGRRIQAFTPLQLQQGLVLYVHDGSEQLTDTFSIVAVSDIRQSAPANINVTVRGINDEAPFIINNTGLHIWEGNAVPIAPTNLGVMDLDTEPENISITLATPTSGFVALSSNLTHPVSLVTQADINNGRVYFIHTGGLTGMFRWEASDNVHSTGSSVFQVTAHALHLVLENNEQLHVFPMTQQPITSTVLLTHTNDYDSQRSIVYMIRKPPVLGQLLLEEAGGVLVPVDNFTQRNINESRVFFEHIRPFSELSARDMFVFDVESPFAEPLKDQEFHLEISVASPTGGGLERYLGLTPLVVAEGGQATVRADNLNLSAVSEYIESYPGAGGTVLSTPNLVTSITSVPAHGLFTLRGKNLTEGDTISVKDIERGRVRYEHDHSDTLRDSLSFTVALAGNGSAPDILLFNGSLNISVTPVNDQPFTLVTATPVLHVVHRQTAVVTNGSLLTTDPDNLPSEIVYELLSSPDHGRLIFNDNFTLPVKSFSQKDVNDGRILYAHDGTNSSARFYFKVSDGKHKAKYTVFTVEVEPLTLELVNHSVVPLQQASTVAYVSSNHLSAVTNGNPNHIFYNISRPPRFGHLYMNDQIIHTFGQVNIDKGEVLYMQMDLNESGDSFRVNIWTWEASLLDVEVRINVIPLVKSKPLVAAVGGRTRLLLDHLDASQLAESTGSNPEYKVKRRPRFGKIKKVSRRSRRSGRSYEVQEFTHEEVRAGHIYYVARNLNLKGEKPLHDALHYVLHVPAPGVQPAEGTLRLSLVESVEAGAVLEDGAEPPRHLRPDLSPPIHDDSDHSLSGSGTTNTIFGIPSDYVVVVVAGIGAVVVVIAIIVIARCATRRHHTDKRRNTGIDGDIASLPPPLPSDSRPNSFMTDDMSELECRPTELPSSPRPGRHLHHNGGSGGLGLAAHLTDSETSWNRDISREVSPAVPQCKVTPLCSDSSPREPPYDPHLAGYPYGVDTSQTDWGVYEKHQPRTTNPMLRKNQYWV